MTNTAFTPLARLTTARKLAAETGTLVTASDRLRREYSYAYDYSRMMQGDKAWAEPSISGFEALLRRDHERARASDPHCPALLSPVEQHQLFRRCAPKGLSHLTTTFEDAWSQVQAWELDFTSESFEATENTRCFANWASAVSAALVESNVITSAQLPGLDYPISALGALRLTGFDVLTAQQRRWLERANAAGLSIVVETDADNDAETRQIQAPKALAFHDDRSELTAAICWAKQRLEECPADAPPPRIAIVVPNLLAQHATVTRLLHAHLEGSEPRSEALYNVGGGLSLASHPLVESALSLLATVHLPTHYTVLQRLLADPALPAINANHAHNRLPGECAEFLTLSELPLNLGSEPLHRILHQIKGWSGSIENREERTIAAWWSDAASVLRNARWHTARNDSEGYQATNALLELLIAGAPVDTEIVPWYDAFSLLESVTAQLLFAPASSPAPIQVLGYLEANELEFDHLWITGMDATAWPTPVTNNPLLPASELARVEAPRTSYAGELKFAERWLERVRSHPHECRVSFVNEDYDPDKPLAGISPLLKHLVVAEPAAESAAAFHPLLNYWARKDISLQLNADTHGLPLPGGRLNRATRRLENQAACPMRGWSLHTLDLEEPIAPHSLPNPLERGVLLHNTLQRLFEEIPSSVALGKHTDSSLVTLCGTLARQQTEKELHRFSQPIRDLEIDRLARSLLVFLQLESKRGDFNVSELEQQITGVIGPWEIHLKVDRIDDVPDGQIVIDYKSTAPSAAKLQDQRLTAPQIPLYVLFLLANGKPISDLLLDDPVLQAGAFAELKPDSAKYVGLRSEHADSLAALKLNSKTPWQQVLTNWCDQLLRLAKEIEQGYAIANPTKDICSNCHLHSLCRYHLSYD